jgi:hypothetical protein
MYVCYTHHALCYLFVFVVPFIFPHYIHISSFINTIIYMLKEVSVTRLKNARFVLWYCVAITDMSQQKLPICWPYFLVAIFFFRQL